ncbi:MAG: acyclic terpene utilization AtuA family protein [Acidimicrobiia bacterium]
MTSLKVLAFVNHVAPAADIGEAIDQALEWGVDVIVAQGTGSDWGAYWLGSGEQFDTRNFRENVRPYLRVAVAHGIPFVFSAGIAGSDAHLEACLEQFDQLCVEEGFDLEVGVLRTEVDPGWLAGVLRDGRQATALADDPSLPSPLTADDLAGVERIVGLAGPEPIVDLLGRGVAGVITGRAVDVALAIAPALARGLPPAAAAHAAKVIECGGLALDPGDPGLCIWAEVDRDGFEVRCPSPRSSVTPKGIAGHSFYERANPWEEKNPGGVLDLRDAAYRRTEQGVRCDGARWHDEPYSVLLEGATRVGYRSIVVLGVRDPDLLGQARSWADAALADLARAARFDDLRGSYHAGVRIFGLDGVLGPLEPEKAVTGHEAAVVVDVVAPTQAQANEIAYFLFVRLGYGPYPGRRTTAGNVAVPFMPVVQPVGPMYRFGLYHALQLDRPDEPFRASVERFGPRGSR